MVHKRFQLYPHINSPPRGLPPSHHPILQIQKTPRSTSASLQPPATNTLGVQLPDPFPPLPVVRALDWARHITNGLSSVYLLRDWPMDLWFPPIRQHLPVDPLAHLILPLQEGLSRLPLLLYTPPPAGPNILPA